MKVFTGGKSAPTEPSRVSGETLPSSPCTPPSPPGQGTPEAVCSSGVWVCGRIVYVSVHVGPQPAPWPAGISQACLLAVPI